MAKFIIKDMRFDSVYLTNVYPFAGYCTSRWGVNAKRFCSFGEAVRALLLICPDWQGEWGVNYEKMPYEIIKVD